MALSSALYAGSSGLSSLGDTMQIIGDNIANVNTIGFKGSTANFQDLLSQSISTMGGGSTQVGSGSAIGDVSANFEQGSFKTTGSSTDLAVGGSGFFVLRESSGNTNYYSRAGNFGFDKDGNMINPNGYIVQGWKLDSDSGNDIGSITDIHLDSFTSKPSATSQIQVIANLDSTAENNSGTDALADIWDGTASPPIDEEKYEYQTTIQVYDSLGSTHDITIYFDKSETDSTYEYIVTCNPSEDKREGALDEEGLPANAAAGLLASGTIAFEPSSGVISNITMASIDGEGNATDLTTDDPDADDYGLIDGKFGFQSDFLGSGASTMDVALDFGATYAMNDDDTGSWAPDSLSTTQFAVDSNTIYKGGNGYGAGDLQDLNVTEEGIIIGSYSNGQRIPLYRVALADFQNVDGLGKLGGNLFSETTFSGEAVTNKPGTNGLGSIASRALEQSNVDIADEFVSMITAQRGFQANSKIITTIDTMLSELMNLKR